MEQSEKLICGDCNKITEFKKGKRGSKAVEILLWSIFFVLGIFYSIWRKYTPKKICPACNSDFLLSSDLPHIQMLLKPKKKRKL